VPALGDYDDGEIGGMIGKGNRSTQRKPAPVPLCPPQTPHAARTRTRAAAVGSQRLNRLSYGTAMLAVTLLVKKFRIFVKAVYRHIGRKTQLNNENHLNPLIHSFFTGAVGPKT
jgi:hypothetical protein